MPAFTIRRHLINSLHHVVIIGGGFGGLAATRASKSAAVQVTLIDRRNFHLFQPLHYQVATGSLSPANIASPLRSILKRQKNAQVRMSRFFCGCGAPGRLRISSAEASMSSPVRAT